jgi:hypothetical protein
MCRNFLYKYSLCSIVAIINSPLYDIHYQIILIRIALIFLTSQFPRRIRTQLAHS